jgi:hypothetical protein
MSAGRMRLLGAMLALVCFTTVGSADLLMPPFVSPDAPLPSLARRGQAIQLLVDGKPFLALAGEVHNSSSSSLEYMKPIWPRLKQMNLNTVLAPVTWDLLEPQEGRFDFTLVDGLIQEARRHDLKIVLLWFGSWKNGLSHYAPDWVKRDTQRFPRVRIENGRYIEVLSPLSSECLGADARAYAALMQHLRRVDARLRTVIMIQMENEVGILGDSRDRSDAANQAFAGPVPQDLLSYLTRHKAELLPEVKEAWSAAGFKPSGTWSEVFGTGVRADEIFMAWTYARYVNSVTDMGKVEYPLPTYMNAWIVQPEDKRPGDYPSGGPQAHMHDVWRAGAPKIDILAPDIYLPNFAEVCGMYARGDNPLFVPESRAGVQGAANAFYAIGQMKAIGYSPFGIENREPDPVNGPIPQAYGVLRQLAPLILDAQSNGTIAGASLDSSNPSQMITLGNYTLEVALRRQRRTTEVPPAGYGLFIATGTNTCVAAGSDIQITFFTNPPGPQIVGLVSVYEGQYVNGAWTPGRKLNGDNIMLDYHLDRMAAENRSGSVVRFEGTTPSIRQITLYRF